MTIVDPNVPKKAGLLRSILDAIYGEDDSLAGISVTRLTTPLLTNELSEINVETTIRFGRQTDPLPPAFNDPADALIIIDGEIIYCAGVEDKKFLTLTRGLEGSGAKFHPIGTLVYDFAQNRSALDFVRRGFMVQYAQGVDLDVVGRNLGVRKCPNLTQEQWREIIKRTAYMPKQPEYSFEQVLDVVFPNQYELITKPSEPWTETVNVDLQSTNTKKGKFLLNGAELQPTTGPQQVMTTFPIHQVLSVTIPTPLTALGFPGLNLYPGAGGGSFVGNTITLSTSPGPIGTPVLVNYGAFAAHYLAKDEDVVDDGDYFAYLSDSSQLAVCLLDHIRAGGIKVKVGIR